MRRLLSLLACIAACNGPDPGDSDGDGGGSGPASSTSTGAVEPTGGTTTGDPDPGPEMRIYPIFPAGSDNSGFLGFDLWQPSGNFTCDEAPAPICSEVPALDDGLLIVGGVLGDFASVSADSRVAAVFPYSGCDLACGTATVTVRIGDGTFADDVELPSDLPCSTADDNIWLGVDFGLVGFEVDHAVELTLTDACGLATKTRTIALRPS
jgi:hypothetical protein